MWNLYKIIFDPMMWLWEMLLPKTKTELPEPEKPDIPVSEVGEPIEELYGTRTQKKMFLAWYGDLRLVPFYSTADKKGKG